MTMYPYLTEHQTFHIDGFIRQFIAKPRRERWLSIFRMKPDRWIGLSVWDLWDDRYVVSGRYERDAPSGAFAYEKYETHKVMVFRIGHDMGGVEEMTLHEALEGRHAVLEGIISIVAGKLAVAINHDGGVCLCRA